MAKLCAHHYTSFFLLHPPPPHVNKKSMPLFMMSVLLLLFIATSILIVNKIHTLNFLSLLCALGLQGVLKVRLILSILSHCYINRENKLKLFQMSSSHFQFCYNFVTTCYNFYIDQCIIVVMMFEIEYKCKLYLELFILLSSPPFLHPPPSLQMKWSYSSRRAVGCKHQMNAHHVSSPSWPDVGISSRQIDPHSRISLICWVAWICRKLLCNMSVFVCTRHCNAILCLTLKTTVMLAHIPEEAACCAGR